MVKIKNLLNSVFFGAIFLIFFLIGLNIINSPRNNLDTSDYSRMGVDYPSNELSADYFPSSSAVYSPISINGNDWKSVYPDIVIGSGTLIDPYVIANLTIDAGNSNGIYIENSISYGIIQNCTIINAAYGIFLEGCSNVSLFSNDISISTTGIYVHNSANCTVNSNSASANTNIGVYVSVSENCTFASNNITANGNIGLYGYGSFKISIINNFVTNNTGSNGGVYFSNSERCIFKMNHFVNNTNAGFTIRDSKSCKLEANTAIDNGGDGIFLHTDELVTLELNVILNNSINGIDAINGINNTFAKNNVSGNGLHGMELSNSKNGTVKENLLSNNDDNGIFLHQGNNCTLRNNDIHGNLQEGINVEYYPDLFAGGNSVSYNGDDGIRLYSTSYGTLSENQVHHNKYSGIFMQYASYISVEKNSVSFNLNNGIYTFSSSLNNISGNNVSQNVWKGIQLGTTSNINNITKNYVVRNSQTGISLWDNADNNDIFENWIIKNDNQDIYHNDELENNIHDNIFIDFLNTRFDASDYSVIAGNMVNFNDTSTGGYKNRSYLWDFADGVTANTQNVSHRFTIGGNYVVSLTIDDFDNDPKSYTNIIAVEGDLLPTASFNVSKNPAKVGEEIYFNDTSSGGNSELTYFWDFGDGSTSTLQNVSHRFSTVGNYDVNLIVSDNDEDNSSFSVQMSVINDLTPNCSFIVSSSAVSVGDVVFFNDTTTGGNQPLSFLWDFADGLTSTLQNISHSFSITGNYTVNLTVTDIDGDYSSYTIQIIVSTPNPNTTIELTTTTTTDDSTKDDGLLSYRIPGYSIRIILVSISIVAVFLSKRKMRC